MSIRDADLAATVFARVLRDTKWSARPWSACGDATARAAVLIPLEPTPAGTRVWFTRRSGRLRAHAGEVCFPGGRAEPEDAGPRETALREAYEETGLTAGSVRACALLPPYATSSGYFVVPVAAALLPGARLSAAAAEVDDVFAAPLVALRHAFASAPVPVPPARAPVVTWAGHEIRGATAAMFLSLFADGRPA